MLIVWGLLEGSNHDGGESITRQNQTTPVSLKKANP